MIDQLNKDTAKRVKEWAVLIGLNVSVRAGSGKAGFIQLHVIPKKSENPYTREYDKTIPPDVCRRMLEVIYPYAKWLAENPKQHSAGNIHTHMATMVTSEWIQFLNQEASLLPNKQA